MMKTINYCAIAATALAIQFGGWQDETVAQSGNSYRGGFEYEDSGEGHRADSIRKPK